MGKVFFFVLIGVLVWVLLFARRSAHWLKKRDGTAKPDVRVEAMRQCTHCGVHLPASEAAEIAGKRGTYSCISPDNCANRPR
jgi:hypothetical protein